jgi:hypothetical protein
VEVVSFLLLLKKASVDNNNNNIKCTEYEWGTGWRDLENKK